MSLQFGDGAHGSANNTVLFCERMLARPELPGESVFERATGTLQAFCVNKAACRAHFVIFVGDCRYCLGSESEAVSSGEGFFENAGEVRQADLRIGESFRGASNVMRNVVTKFVKAGQFPPRGRFFRWHSPLPHFYVRGTGTSKLSRKQSDIFIV